MTDCIFCSIVSEPSKLFWENDTVAAFNDIQPKAPTHILVVPKRHIAMLDYLDSEALGGQLLAAVQVVARRAGIDGAYKVHINNGRAAGQVVDHLHLHVLGGEGGGSTADIA